MDVLLAPLAVSGGVEVAIHATALAERDVNINASHDS
jgi:hypothetical protein